MKSLVLMRDEEPMFRDSQKELLATDRYKFVKISEVVGLICVFTSFDYQILSRI